MDDRDAVGQREQEFHVVLDCDERQGATQAADQLGQPRRGLPAEPRSRLVETQHTRIRRQRDADFEGTPVAIGELLRPYVFLAAQTYARQHVLGLVGGRGNLPRAAEQREAVRARFRHRHGDIVERAEVIEEIHSLERARHALARDRPRRQARDVFSVEQDLPAMGTITPRQYVEAGRLAGAVRTHDPAEAAIGKSE